MSQQLKKKFIGNDQVDGDKLLLEDGQAVRAMDGATEVELAKITSSEVYLNGFKVLQSSGLIPADRLPSYVDDVLEFANLAAFPVTGETGKIYIALDNNKQYRWSGSVYVQITSGAVDSVNGETGVVTLDAGDIFMVSAPATTIETKLTNLQDEIDDTQAGAGLETDGSYVAPAVSNYLSAASSLKDADSKLDAQIKVVADDLAQEVLDREAVQDNLDTHVNAAIDAHDASAISISAITNIVATDVQGALAEIQGQLDTVAGDFVDTAGDTMTGQLTMEAADILVDYSVPGVTETATIGQGVISSVFIDASDSWSTEIYAGGETIARTSADSSTSDRSVTITAIHGDPVLFAETIDYANNSNSTINMGANNIILEYGDNSNGDFFQGNYSTQSFSVTKTDGVTGENRQISADLVSGTVLAFSDTGSGPEAIMPTVDWELAPKKYVDDQDAAQSTALSNHLSDSVDAHDASAISFVAAGDLVATDVQAAIQELDSEKARIQLSNLAATTAINSDLTFSRGAGVTANIRGKTLVPGEASGALQVFSGSVTGGVNSGWLNLFSGNIITSTTGDSGAVNINSGNSSNDPASTSQSGQVTVKSGNTVNGASGIAVFKSGDASGTGNSGIVALGSGDSASGSAGDVFIFSGIGAGSVRGFVQIEASKLNMLNAIDMNSHQINELADGTSAADAVNKGQLDSGLALKLSLTGGTMSGSIAMGNNSITNLTMTSDAHSAATKEYVDNVAEGLHVHAPARLVRSIAIVGSYNNGVGGVGAKITPTSPVTTIDGISSFAIGQRIIVRAQANSWENGIYTVSAIDGSNHITELTRATDFDSAEEAAGGDFIFVQAGNTYANTGWVGTNTTTALGFGVSDPIEFLQFSGAGSYSAGDGLDLNGTIFSVNVSEIAGAGLEDDGSNNLRIASSAAGDGLSLAAGVLSVNAGDGIQLISDAVAAKVSDIAGAGLEDDGSNNLRIASSAAGDGIDLAAGVLSVNVSDIAGHGLESDGGSPANLRVKKEFSTISDISVSSSGLSIANRWGKEAYTVVAADTVLASNYYDLDFEIEPSSLVAFVDRLAIHEGASFDYTLSVVGGVTRVTFLNTLVTPGQQKLAAGDQLFFTYQKKAV